MNIIWFRKDLRTFDNPAIVAALKKGPCKALFIATPKQWERHDMAPIQVDFIERHLNFLQEQLANLNIPFEVLEATDYSEQSKVLINYCSEHNVTNVFANKEAEINEYNRDVKLIDGLHEQSITLHLIECDVIVNKGEVLNGKSEMYKVFTPFKNAWVKYIQQHGISIAPSPIKQDTCTTELFPLHSSIKLNAPKKCSRKWPLISKIYLDVIPEFFDSKHDDYKIYRDIPSIKGTSGFSPYLAIGALSPKALLINTLQKHPDILENPKADKFSWLNELAWRDFYKHLIFHYPDLCKHRNFQEKYNHLNWVYHPTNFTAWCEGKTGYPIVDAAMKQLVSTGWMHNRLRMIVASFLTKHLLIDWRLGERFFMQHLIDGDLSANNGGWQWAAGTGCDAQPYFRIFNPITQSERFDPDGTFIRKYIKVLEHVPPKHIHFPHKYLNEIGQPDLYTAPIVDHKTARLTALEFYKQ